MNKSIQLKRRVNLRDLRGMMNWSKEKVEAYERWLEGDDDGSRFQYDEALPAEPNHLQKASEGGL